MTYREAIEELESIMADIKSDQPDIDQLAKKLSRATELIKFCKTRLKSTEGEIKGIFDDQN